MSLISDSISTGIDRFRKHAPIVVGFALVLVSMNVVMRVASGLTSSLGIAVQVAIFVLVFAFSVYLSYVALRFSYRALDEPVFDLSTSASGFSRLLFGQVVLSVIALPYILVPLLVFAAYALPLLVEQLPAGAIVVIDQLTSPVFVAFATILFVISLYLSVRLSMTSFRIVVRGDGPLAALARSWRMTRGAFWPVCGYLIIPIGVLMMLAGALALVSMPLFSLGVVGSLIILVLALLLYVVFVLVIDPALAIGKAELFESLESRIT